MKSSQTNFITRLLSGSREIRIAGFMRLAIGVFAAVLSFSHSAQAASAITWSGTSGVDLNWNTNNNWTPSGSPSGDDVTFSTTGTNAAGTVTNTVNQSYNIDSLTYTNTNGAIGAQTTSISNTFTLSATGATSTAFTVGSSSVSGTTYVVLKGLGAFGVTGGTAANFNVGVSGVAITGNQTLDMSGLAFFTANVGTFGVGVETANAATNETGTVLLAGSNSITATTISVGSAAAGTNNIAGGNSSLSLGGTNTIFADTINIGAGKNPGSLQFESSLTGAIVTIANRAGTAGANLNVGINNASNTGSTPVSTVDFSGGTLSGTFGTITLGRGAAGTGAGTGTGNLTFGPGSLTATTIISGTGGSSSNSAAIGTGNITMNANAGTLTATTVSLGNGSSTAGATGSFTQNGGTANLTTLTLGNQIAGTVNATYTLAGGILAATTIQAGTGTATRTFNWTGGTIENLAGSNLTLGSGLTLTLTGAETFTASASQSIAVNAILAGGGALTSNGLGTLTLYGANTYSGGTIVASGTTVAGAGSSFSASNTLTLGSATGNTSGIFQIGDGTAVVSTTVTSLATAGAGTSNAVVGGNSSVSTLTVNNSASDTYSGILGGASGNQNNLALTKIGTGALILTGSSAYTGATTITSGTLQLGNGGTTGALSAGSSITDNGALVFNRSNTVTQGTDFSSAAITGSGGLIQAGGATSTLVLNAANTYNGATTVTSGTLDLLNQSAIQNSTLTMNGGGLVFDQSVGGNAFTFGGLAAASSGVGFDIALQNNAGTPAAVALTVGGNNANTAYAGALSGSGSLIKVGTGTLTLSSSSTFTGGVTINGGSLSMSNVNALGSGTTTLVSGTLQETVASLPNTINVTGTGVVRAAASSATVGLGTVVGSGNLQYQNADTSVTADLTGNLTAFSGTLSLVNSGGSFFRFNGSTGGANFYLDLGSTGVAVNNRSANGTITIGSLAGGTNATLSGASGGGNVTATTYVIGARGDNTTFAGAITNGGATLSITKNGAGTLTLSGSNIYTGTTTISAGELSLGNQYALNGGGNIKFSGGSLQYTGSNTVDYSNFIVSSGSAISIDTNSQTVTFASSLASSNTGGLTKLGAGTLTLTNANVYTGTTTVSGGTLQTTGLGLLGSQNNGLTVNTGGALDLAATSQGVGALNGTGGTILNSIGSSTSTLSVGNNNATGAYAGVIEDNAGSGGTVALSKVGTGTETLTGVNTYTGATTITSGTLQLGNGGATGAISPGSTITDNGNLLFNRNNTVTQGTDFGSGAIGGTGAVTLQGGGTLVLNAANTYSGATTVTSGTLDLLNQSAIQNSTLTMNGGGLVFDQSVGSNAFTFGGLAAASSGVGFDIALQNNAGTPAAVALTVGGNNANTTYVGVLSGSGSLIKTGTGTLTLTAANTYTGNTTLSQGTLQVGNGGTTGALGSGTAVFQGGTLNNGYSTATSYGMGQNIFVGSGQSGTINMGNRMSLNGSVGGSGTLNLILGTTVSRDDLNSSWIGFAGQVNFVGSGVARLLYNGGNFDPNNFANASVDIEGSAFLQAINFSGGNTYNVGALSGTSTAAGITSAANGAATWSVGALNTSTTFAGSIQASNALTKVGTGTLTLNGNNTYTGATIVSAGTLLVSGSLSGSGPVTVNASSTLAGYGTIDGATTIAKNGILAPAAGALTTGTMTLGNNLTLSGTSTVALELNPSSSLIDFLAVTGTLSIGTGDTLTVALLNNASAGESFEFATGGTINGTFANVSLTGANSSSFSASVDYNQSGELILDVAAIPEPGTWAMMLGGMAMLVVWQRSRSRRHNNA